MRIITLHCDYIKFKAEKKALKGVEELSAEDKKEQEVKEALVVLTAVEKGDGSGEMEELVDSVAKTAKDVKAKNIVLYPYAHLSSNLASPDVALGILKDAEKALSSGLKVSRAPFGYYKKFELKCKGHPLSELSKEFGGKGGVVKGSDGEYDIKSLLTQISRSKLDTSKLKENDHRILGQKLDLFSFNESAPGAVFWHPNGLVVYNELVVFLKDLLVVKYGYKEIATPHILDNKLWKISGHWGHYKENMFLTEHEGRHFGVKPMNCPGAMLVYRTNTRSYKELPLRFGEFGTVHRQELSGVLAGLFRVVKFTQDDAHVFCEPEQVESEIINMLEFAKIIYKDTFGFDYKVELSTRPAKFMGEKKDWDAAEKALESALKKSKVKFKMNKGDGAFYGPKIDIHIKDSLGRSWQVTTIQLDMQMPKRFELSYTGKDNREHTPVVIHRAILGSLERFIGILLEHVNGNFPLWLAPEQVRIVSFTDRNVNAAEKIVEELKGKGFRVEGDFRSTTVNEKVRDAEMLKVPVIIVIGDKEEKSGTLAVRIRGEKVKFGVKMEGLVKELRGKIENRS